VAFWGTTAMNAPVRFGIVGLRRGAGIARALRAFGGATISVLYDPDVDVLARGAGELDALPCKSWAVFLGSDIDAAIIASPPAHHVPQAVDVLRSGKHVVSEVPACTTMEQADDLVRAVRESKCFYMLAENYRYLDEVELVRRLNLDGRFGDVYYGEGEYLHDCRDLWYDADRNRTWRGIGWRGIYCTHSLGPLLYITDDRVTSVSSLEVAGGRFDAAVTRPTMSLMNMTTEGGRSLRVRVDHVSPRPHQMAYFSCQGTHGSYESWRGFGDSSKVWLADRDEPSHVDLGAKWHSLAELADKYTPERLSVPPEARLGGHGTSEYWMLRDVVAGIRGEMAPAVSVYSALDYTLPGILAPESAAQGGAPMVVPDPRTVSLKV
jgi:predicted dehydrogenase